MIEPGQICRVRMYKRFKIAIVLGPSLNSSKLRASLWQCSNADAGGHWSAPHPLYEHLLVPLGPDFDLTSSRGLIVSAAKRSITNGMWAEVHNVGMVQP